jgi:3-deoxy-D-manno-octulosonate 8-phosphate phosphatase (KDO 8-P phosphatase)
LTPFIEVRFVTGDKRGFGITSKRVVDDMKQKLDLVSTVKRVEWIAEQYDLDNVVYMGDGIFDHYVMRNVGYSIAPSNADKNALSFADYVTKRRGGDRAVAEACLHLLDKFFEPYNADSLCETKIFSAGVWGI